MTENIRSFGRVAVLMGGTSPERDVSLMSGEMVLAALIRKGVDAFGVDIRENYIDQLTHLKADRVFNVLHGGIGENGVTQAILQSLHLPYSDSGVLASALAMDKLKSKAIWRHAGFPTADYMICSNQKNAYSEIMKFGFPLVIKPVHGGSTQGVTKVMDASNLNEAIQCAYENESEVFVERLIDGPEYTVGIMGGSALPSIQIVSEGGFYDYNAKYFVDSTQYHCPSGLSDDHEKRIQDLALRAFNALGCSNWGRVDVMADKNGNFYLLEANTVPGMTSHSLVPKAAKQMGIDYDELVLKILEFAQ